jgi:hypothetical protein
MSNDGGHAFPIADAYDADGRLIAYGNAGMTLRDWFAGQVLAGMLANPEVMLNGFDVVARRAYNTADVMLDERERRK